MYFSNWYLDVLNQIFSTYYKGLQLKSSSSHNLFIYFNLS